MKTFKYKGMKRVKVKGQTVWYRLEDKGTYVAFCGATGYLWGIFDLDKIKQSVSKSIRGEV